MIRTAERIRVVRMGLVALLIALPTGLFAELLPAERASVKNVIDASAFVSMAEREMAGALNAGGTTLESRAALAGALNRMIGVSRELTQGTTILLGANPVQFQDYAGVKAWDAMTRAEQVDRAFFYLRRVPSAIDGTKIAVMNAQTHNTHNSVYQRALAQAQVWLQEARVRAASLDTTLRYADPLPALCAGCTIAPVVGPHGDYARAQKFLYFATKYWRDYAEDFVATYANGPVLSHYGAYAGALQHYTLGIDAQHRAMGLLAGITWTPAEAAEDGFCRTLRVMKLLTDGESNEATPFQYHYNQGYWRSAWNEAEPYRNSLTRLSDSWKHNDSAVWELMVFANSQRCPK